MILFFQYCKITLNKLIQLVFVYATMSLYFANAVIDDKTNNTSFCWYNNFVSLESVTPEVCSPSNLYKMHDS